MLRTNKIKKNRSILTVLFLCVFVGGYAFFFTSKLWMDQRGAATRLTPVGNTQTFEKREITLLSWKFCKESMVMEVQIEIKNTAFDGYDFYIYEANDSNKNKGTINKIVETEDFVVVDITDIDRNWTEYVLKIGLPSEAENGGYASIYTNINDVEKAESLDPKSENEYQAERLDIQIDGYKRQIESINEQILSEIEYQNTCSKEIDRLIEKQKYQTEEEIAESKKLISGANAKINESVNKVKSYKEDIEEYEEKIKNAEELRSVFMSE